MDTAPVLFKQTMIRRRYLFLQAFIHIYILLTGIRDIRTFCGISMIRENLFGDLLLGHTWLTTPGDLVVPLPNNERGRVFPRPIIDIRENINILWLYFWNISNLYPYIGNIKVHL